MHVCMRVFAVCPDGEAVQCPTCTAPTADECTAVQQMTLCSSNYVSYLRRSSQLFVRPPDGSREALYLTAVLLKPLTLFQPVQRPRQI